MPVRDSDTAADQWTLANTYLLACVATLGGMLFGFDISSMSAIVVTDQYVEYFENPSGVRQGAIGSSLAAGSIIGSIMAGPISDRWGRRDRYEAWPGPGCSACTLFLPISSGFR